MKNFMILSAFFFALSVFSACGDDVEEFTCTCTTTTTVGSSSTTSTTTSTITAERDDAERTCEASNSEATVNDVTTVTICEI